MEQYYEHILAQEITKVALDYMNRDFSFSQLTDPGNKIIVDQYVQFVFERYFEILSLVEKRLNPR